MKRQNCQVTREKQQSFAGDVNHDSKAIKLMVAWMVCNAKLVQSYENDSSLL